MRSSPNLSYGSIISVYIGPDEAITALTDEGIDELRQMLAHARRSTKKWIDFLDDFVSDPDIIGIPAPRAVWPDFLIDLKPMPYVMRYSHFPH